MDKFKKIYKNRILLKHLRYIFLVTSELQLATKLQSYKQQNHISLKMFL